MTTNPIAIAEELAEGFHAGVTRSVSFRLEQLLQLRRLLTEQESVLCGSAKLDLGKSDFEEYLIDVSPVLANIDYAIENLSSWVAPESVYTPVALQPGWSSIEPEPLGVVLILGPWNVNIFSTLGPLVGAISAGNAAIIKPSELTENLGKTIVELVNKYLDTRVYRGVFGGPEIPGALLNSEKRLLDLVFFTGSTTVGKIIYSQAATNLIPCVLELGGKSPCVVAGDLNSGQLDIAAKRLVWGAFTNAGQICIRPDYLLVHRAVKTLFTERVIHYTKAFYGGCTGFTRIVNKRNFQRIKGMLENAQKFVIHRETSGSGVPSENDALLIPPTIVDFAEDFTAFKTSALMREEVFGPVLTIVNVESVETAVHFVNERSKGGGKPLAAYLFANDSVTCDNFRKFVTAGCNVINDCLVQNGNIHLPFGGVGESGLGGRFQGKAGFDVFSNIKSVLQRKLALDIPFRYPPYNERLLRFFLNPRLDRVIRGVLRLCSLRNVLDGLLLVAIALLLHKLKK